MTRSCRAVALALGSLTLLAPGAQGGTAADPRAQLSSLGSALDAAVGKVSRSAWTALARVPPRGYHLKGFGAVFVLGPRVLPSRPQVVVRTSSRREVDRALAEASRRLEQSLKTAESDGIRRQIEATLKALRQTQADLRRSREEAGQADREPHPPEKDLDEMEKEVEAQLAAHAESWREVSRARERELERRLRAFEEEAEAFRREAEKARLHAEREIRVRVMGEPSPPPAPEAPPAPPEGPAAPRPPAALAPPASAPPAPPWRFWLQAGEDEKGRTPERVVQEVRAAVTRVLESRGAELRMLGPEEFVVVAVDFVSRAGRVAGERAERTLIVRVRKKELEERRSGRIGPDVFRKRVEYVEY